MLSVYCEIKLLKQKKLIIPERTMSRLEADLCCVLARQTVPTRTHGRIHMHIAMVIASAVVGNEIIGKV